ncbi:MAG: UTP--glucose-1-phosphate uridylyltransferase [Brockia lithotrophica]|uniref:UTP--glucose-1-phosphate uridylyltransferase n=1 Tax=Brockia lithotrophica TaxID=933949 RepID=A0A2T5GAX0_9BACL|nr:UTP--glucose-1-phosphate uridylyltransferase GalU [Brockia lithotrophica]PTQ53308.1 MAG: UTP--glucose-1-phosphate uridylyltransferase [Brockia lithotrophica]
MKVRKAIIPAAGLGTRFLPATKAMPKEMLPIVDKPTIQYIVEEAAASGIEDIIVVTGKGKRAIEDHFDRNLELEAILRARGKEDLLREVLRSSELADIHYIRQKEPRGLGHAVWSARKFVGDEPFAVLLGDDLIVAKKPGLRQLIDLYERYRASILAVRPIPPEEIHRYGVIAGKEISPGLYAVEGLVEKPAPDEAPSNLGIVGRYVLTPRIFTILDELPPGRGGEIQLTDAIARLNEHEAVYAYVIEGERFDVGEKLDYLITSIEFALRREDLRARLLRFLEERIRREGEALSPRLSGKGHSPHA